MKLSHFSSISEAVGYICDELLFSLQEELIRMESSEKNDHTDEDREQARNRLSDIKLAASFVEQAFSEIDCGETEEPDLSRCEGLERYVVEYEVPHIHRVQVGVFAESDEDAASKAEKAFDIGDIWDDTPDMPLLMDDFEEDENAGVPLKFKVIASNLDAFPEPDASVTYLRNAEQARCVVRAVSEMRIADAI